MAGLACRRKTRRGVIGIGRVVVVRLVAAYTSRVGDAVVAVDVALGAGDGCRVEACQRPPRGRVIEPSVDPQNRVMAGLTCGRETRRNMIHGRLGIVVVGLMAGHASRVG